MKTLILYATKYGATKEIAKKMATLMEGAQIYNVKEKNIPNLDFFDCVLIGSSIYAGSIRKEMKEYMALNKNILKDKKLGLFLSGMGAESSDKVFKDNFPAELLETAISKEILGGIFDPQKANKLEKTIFKLVAKQGEYISTINQDKIKAFVESV